MGFSTEAIRKGVSAEYLAKAYFSKRGFIILNADTHETHYDFIAVEPSTQKQYRVQVKAVVTTSSGLLRIRNKRGSNNCQYKIEDYDILAGVYVEDNTIYLFESKIVNREGQGESLTVGSVNGRELLSNKNRIVPIYKGSI